jgi:hypothetical protein
VGDIIAPNSHKDGDEASSKIDWNLVINIAQKAWKFVADNKPFVDVKKMYANALPKGVNASTELDSWKVPVSITASIRWVNALKHDLVRMDITITFIPGGQYNGKGLYLDAVSIIPTYVAVKWPQKLEASVEVPSTVNMGTAEQPIAAMEMNLNYKFTNWIFEKIEGTYSFWVQGNGGFRSVSHPHVFPTIQPNIPLPSAK